MYPPLDSALNWASSSSSSSNPVSRRFVLITDELKADASFLLHHFISRHLRQNDPRCSVTLIALAQTYQHYVLVAKKLGVNLTTHTQTRRFTCLDSFSDVRTATGPFAALSSKSTPSSDDFARTLFASIRQTFSSTAPSATADSSPRPCIIFDDLSVLLYMGVPVKDIVRLVMACRTFVDEHDGFLIVLAHADTTTPQDDEQVALVQSLTHVADHILEVRGLVNGVTQGVHGQLSVIRGPLLDDSDFHPQLLHYRVVDSGVQFFAKGLSTGIL
ncbi:Elongator subunit elp6 [Borealophlyctis nickersoniae]|nr:Elongator subunit elp6 [Borealophlyctis nickersoniae]